MVKVNINGNKHFIYSKTLWVSSIGFLAFVVQGFTGFIVEPEVQGMILMLILATLRFITKETIVWN
tara:strand:- start:139 stop:336 length:198 start_codon:yes stop_codon:yes gene_type:complete